MDGIMAKEKKPKGYPKDKTKFLRLAQDRYQAAVEAHKENRDKSNEDLEFIEGGNQWGADIKTTREGRGSPCLEINKLPGKLDVIVGEQRQNRPAIKVIPFDSESDPETAEIFTGLIRNIEYTSQGRVADDHAFEHASAGGEGFLQIATEYAADDMFEQNIVIKPILNSSSVHWDPSAEDVTLKDAMWFFIETKTKRSEFELKYPSAALTGWNDDGEYDAEWVTKDEIKVCAYWLKIPIKKMLYQVLNRDGTTKVIDEKPGEGQEIVKDREVNTFKVVRYLITSHDILEGPKDFASKYIPIIPVWGKELNIKGRRVLRGMVRHAKDPQRLYNYARSSSAELMSAAPKSPYLVTPKQVKDHTSQWNRAHKENFAYLLYNPDPEAKGPPKRETPPQASSAIQTEIMISDQEIDDTTVLHKASMGEKSNEKSGVAIERRARQGSVANYPFIDNLARAKIHEGAILIDLIQNIYDTERIVRIMNEDETTQHITINSFDEKDKKPLNDITAGKYDAIVSIGPSYLTQREEASDSMMAFIGAFPQAAPFVGDLVAKNQNWPGADDFTDRLKGLVPPHLLKEDERPDAGDGATQPGQPPPEAVSPADQAKLQETQAKLPIEVQILQVKLAQEQATLEKKQAEAKKAQQELAMQGREGKETF